MDRKEMIHHIKELGATNVRFAVTDIDGILRGKIICTEKLIKAIHTDIGFCNVIFGWDVQDECYNNSIASGWHTGYPDAKASIDIGSFRKIPWENDKPFFLGDFSTSEVFSKICPRSILKNIHTDAMELGIIPKFSAEFEWFNFDESPQSLEEKSYHNPTPLTPGMFGYSVLRASQQSEYINDLFDQLYEFGIPLEGIHTETGPGVYEAAITYDNFIESADRAVLFKTAVKEIASKHNITASFMAKWNIKYPGCSCHIHQSLWNEEGKNLFFDSLNQYGMSTLMESYIAGQLHCLPHILPLFAPTTNSYKRYVEGSWAPTTLSWGIENRTTAIRVINQNEVSQRVELRVPGADCNPYLSMSASLASGLYGIKNNLTLDLPISQGNEYDQEESIKLPKSLKEAVSAMKKSSIPTELFGEDFVDHFIRTREWEINQYDEDIENWELKRYFEII